ncbi:MAG: hypothetical protein ACI9SK_001052 [Zhongshania sp.]|jgi:hypothetical protein
MVEKNVRGILHIPEKRSDILHGCSKSNKHRHRNDQFLHSPHTIMREHQQRAAQ